MTRANVTRALASTREEHPPRTFTEHLHTLLGGSTWREPMLGATPSQGRVPASHEVAAALGMARHMIERNGVRSPDPADIGPLIAADFLFGQTRHACVSVRLVAEAMAGDRASRLCQRCKPWLRIVAWAAYSELANGHALPLKPASMATADWDLLIEAASRVFSTLAEDAVHRARAAWRTR